MNLGSVQDYGKEAEIGAWRLSMWSTYEDRRDRYEGSSSEPNTAGERVEIAQVFLDADYTFHPDWSVSLTLSYLDITQRMETAGTTEREQGLGDTLLMAHWLALDRPWGEQDTEESVEGWIDPARMRLKIDAGLSLPTGDVSDPQDAAVPPPPPFGPPPPPSTQPSTLQLGTGTFNPILGANFRMDWGGVAASVDARWMYPLYENRYDLQTGSYQLYSISGEVVPLEDLRVALGLELEHRGQDRLDGESVDVGGGWRQLLHPQVVYTPTESVNLFLGASLPICRKFDDPQIDSDARWEGGIQFWF